jgi:hypothetical protein
VVLSDAMRVPFDDWGPWTPARFASQEARDRFLHAITFLDPDQGEAQPMPDEVTGALVRWHSGQFLGLNDIAYAHGGRIQLIDKRRTW